MTYSERARMTGRSPMLHTCTVEGCTTIVFGRGPCIEHEPRRLPLAEQLLADAVAVAQRDLADGEAAADDAKEAHTRE